MRWILSCYFRFSLKPEWNIGIGFDYWLAFQHFFLKNFYSLLKIKEALCLCRGRCQPSRLIPTTRMCRRRQPSPSTPSMNDTSRAGLRSLTLHWSTSRFVVDEHCDKEKWPPPPPLCASGTLISLQHSSYNFGRDSFSLSERNAISRLLPSCTPLCSFLLPQFCFPLCFGWFGAAVTAVADEWAALKVSKNFDRMNQFLHDSHGYIHFSVFLWT